MCCSASLRAFRSATATRGAPSGKNDLAQDQFNRGHRAVDMAANPFQQSGSTRESSLAACDLVRKTALESWTNEIGLSINRSEPGKTGVDERQSPLHRKPEAPR